MKSHWVATARPPKTRQRSFGRPFQAIQEYRLSLPKGWNGENINDHFTAQMLCIVARSHRQSAAPTWEISQISEPLFELFEFSLNTQYLSVHTFSQYLSLCSGQESHCRTYPRDPFAWQAVGIRQAHCHTNVPNLHETTKFTASFQFFQFHSFTQSSTVVCCPVTRSSHQKDLAPMRHRIEGFQDTFDLRQRLRSDLKPKCPMSLDFFWSTAQNHHSPEDSCFFKVWKVVLNDLTAHRTVPRLQPASKWSEIPPCQHRDTNHT